MWTISPKMQIKCWDFSSVIFKYTNRTWNPQLIRHLYTQLEYAFTVWSPHTATDIQKIESVQCRAARWATRDYRYISSVTSMLNDLNWRPLGQSRINCRLVMMFKLVSIPASYYLTPNRRQSRHIHSLAYRQISTLKNYYKYTFFPRTVIHWNALPAFIPLLPTLAQFSNAVCQVVHLSP